MSKYLPVALLYIQHTQETIYQPIQLPYWCLIAAELRETDECVLYWLSDINVFFSILVIRGI